MEFPAPSWSPRTNGDLELSELHWRKAGHSRCTVWGRGHVLRRCKEWVCRSHASMGGGGAPPEPRPGLCLSSTSLCLEALMKATHWLFGAGVIECAVARGK